MKLVIATATAVALIVSPAVYAKSASKEENLGVSAGAVVGAIAGGPIGFIVGAAIGAKIGDNVHKDHETIDALNASLDQSNRDLTDLHDDVQYLNRELDVIAGDLERAQQQSSVELASLMEAGIAMDLLFRTDESVLADTTGTRLSELAGRIAAMPGIRVQLDGFADERGDESYNRELSQKRVDYVRDQLVEAGVPAERILSAAHGETVAADDSVDSLAFERRVALKLFIESSASVAANP